MSVWVRCLPGTRDLSIYAQSRSPALDQSHVACRHRRGNLAGECDRGLTCAGAQRLHGHTQVLGATFLPILEAKRRGGRWHTRAKSSKMPGRVAASHPETFFLKALTSVACEMCCLENPRLRSVPKLQRTHGQD
jgi:hypothetical protein